MDSPINKKEKEADDNSSDNERTKNPTGNFSSILEGVEKQTHAETIEQDNEKGFSANTWTVNDDEKSNKILNFFCKLTKINV